MWEPPLGVYHIKVDVGYPFLLPIHIDGYIAMLPSVMESQRIIIHRTHLVRTIRKLVVHAPSELDAYQ